MAKAAKTWVVQSASHLKLGFALADALAADEGFGVLGSVMYDVGAMLKRSLQKYQILYNHVNTVFVPQLKTFAIQFGKEVGNAVTMKVCLRLLPYLPRIPVYLTLSNHF